jgi:branched-chain amino acid transport system permease protein
VVEIVAPSQSNDAVALSMTVVPAAAAALLGGFRRLDLAVVGGLVLGMLDGALAQLQGLTLLRYFLPFLMIVGLLLWLQRREVWDVAR